MTPYADGALQLSVADRVATLALCRPEARNAINVAMWTALPRVIETLSQDGDVGVVVLRGAAENFASGADIAEFPTIFADRAAALAYGGLLERATCALADLDKPVIAAVEGYCLGAGLALALACDLRVASSASRLGAPPAKLGLMYSLTDTRRLVDAVGASTAKAMLFTARVHSAAEALRLGLVDEVHAPDTFETELAAIAAAIAALSPWSIARAKSVVRLILAGGTQETDTTRGWFADAVEGPDFAEGVAAFRARRPPRFGG